MALDKSRPSIDLGEDDDAFARRRATEERQQIAKSSCVVRSVHEDLLETYEEQLARNEHNSATLTALLASMDQSGVNGSDSSGR